MDSIKNWLTKNSLGRALLLQECQFLQTIIGRLQDYNAIILGLSPINFFQYLTISSDHQIIYVAGNLPCDVISSWVHLPFKDNSIDMLVCYHAIEFCQHQSLLIPEMIRVLKPEGYIVICSFNPHRLWVIGPQWRGGIVIRKQNCLSVNRLNDMLKNSKARVLEGRFMCYTPLLSSYFNVKQINFLEHAGHRWWPSLSSVYAVVAQKKY